jgi:O-acetyl-ADP-ribose deacetylase (regulator of RNase III)
VKEAKVDILSPAILKTADAICFTSNGIVKSNGELVMGAGVAKAFKERWPILPAIIGSMVKHSGNRVYQVRYDVSNWLHLVSFPTKHHWNNPSDLALIKKSARELVELANQLNWTKVYLPRPGVGLGGLDWNVVKAAIEPLLDDRFTVVYK